MRLHHSWLGAGFLVAMLAGSTVASAQPVPAQPEAEQPPLGPQELPAPPAEPRLAEVLRAEPGGLTSEETARRAVTASPDLEARQAAVRAAAQKVDQAVISYVPRLQLLARYVRLSDVDQGNLGGGGGFLVGTNQEGPVQVSCPPNPDGSAVTCTAHAAGVSFSFPVLLDMYTLQGTLTIPLSDYLLRLTQNHAAASRSQEAAEHQERATVLKVRSDSKNAYYQWVRARGAVVVAEQGLETAQANLRDARVALAVGSASRADVLQVESRVAQSELFIEQSHNFVSIAEEQLRVILRDPGETQYKIGENVFRNTPVLPPTNMRDLYSEAFANRPELKAMDATVKSLRSTRSVIAAAYLPRLDAFGNVYYSNPNQRIFPQEDKWSATWDVGAQLSWTINDTLGAGAQTGELDARIAEVNAQKSQLENGIRLQVTQAYNAVREAQVAQDTTQRQLEAAEEAFRVRRELYRAGRATATELTLEEAALTRARFDALNARIGMFTARVNLDYALGRGDTARRP